MNYEMILSLAFLFVYGFDLFGKYRLWSCIYFLFMGIISLNKGKITLNKRIVIVIAFSVSYYIFALLSGGIDLFDKILQYIIMYISGTHISNVVKRDGSDLFVPVFTICSGFAFLGILTSFLNGWSVSYGIRAKDLWSSTQIASTQISVWMIFFVALIPWFVLGKNRSIYLKLAFFSTSILCVLSFLIMSSRTAIVAIIITLILLLSIEAFEKKSKKLLGTVIFLSLLLAFYSFNIFDIQEKLALSNLVAKLLRNEQFNGAAFNTTRKDIWLYFMNNWHEHLFGGYHISKEYGKSMHNIFFDLYDQAGIIPSVLFVCFFILSIKDTIQIKLTNKEYYYGLLSWIIIACLAYFSEPIWFYGRSTAMALMFFMFGIVNTYSYSFRNNMPINIQSD